MLEQLKRKLQDAGLMGGILKIETCLEARHYEARLDIVQAEMGGNYLPLDNPELLDFLRSHPARLFPHMWREVKRDYRKTKNRVVTTAFVNDIVDVLQAIGGPLGTIDDYKYHDSGTGVGNEAAGDTALGTPCGEARDTGTQIEGASANIYKSVATHTYAGAFAITEHGLFNAAANGTLMDRTKFAAINVVATNQIEFTFQITFTAGG